ncbi:MAG: Gfo/Idh/MocA family protein, partial [Promethearchaeota archaeon]
MAQVRLGIIGTGARAGIVNTLIRDEKKRGDVVALCDVRHEAIERFERLVKKRLGHGTKNYTDYRDLLDNPDVDAVLISTPDHLHHEMGVAALKAKKHVFLEKPVGINLDQMIEIVKAARDARRFGKILEIGYVLRYAPFFVGMKQLLEEDEIGRPLFVQALEEYYGAYHFYRGWWKSRKHVGGIMIQKICHDMDLHCWMFGKPKKVV